MSIIPPRSSDRTPARSPVWADKTKTYIIPILMTALLLQVLFLGNMSYLFGSLFNSGHRMHNLKILAIDYDGGDIGKAISGAYSALQSNQFPSVEFGSSSEYDTPDKIRDAVCKHGYWGAVYTHPGASSRLFATIKGDNTTTYNPQDAVTTIYNSAYYPAVFSSVKGSLQSLTSVAANMYPMTSSDILNAVNLTGPASASTFLNPFQSSVWDIMPTEQGSRVLLNTVAMVMAILMQFFFQMGFNGITAKVLQSQSKRDVYIFRLITGKAYTFISALGMAGYIWAFRENWGVDAGQFFETWMCLWFYMDINYLIIDTIIGTVIPMQYFSFFLLTWIIINIASTVYPFDLTPGFFHWAWALPAHNVWLLLVGIWSGCRAKIDVTLPILFSWWIAGHASSAWSVRKRCLMAGVEAKVQSHNDTTDEFDRYSTEQSQQMVLERMNTQGSRQDTNDQNFDLEANRLGQGQRNGDDSRTFVNETMSPEVRDDAKEQTV